MTLAQDVLIRYCKDYKDDAEAWLLLGCVYNAMNNPQQAINPLEKAIHLDPSSAAAHFHLAIARTRLGQHAMALTSMESCLALDQSFPGAGLRISALYEQTGQQMLARHYAEQVIKKQPGNQEALARVARIEARHGDLDTAMRLYRQILQDNPDDFRIAAALADLLIQTGDLETASATIATFLDRKPVPNAIAFVFSDICQFSDSCHEAIELLEDILNRSNQPRQKHIRIIFALAKLYDRIQKHDRAFAYASEANSLKHNSVNVHAYKTRADILLKTWNPDFHSRLPTSDLLTKNIQPVFIIGMPRSGTSLTEQILASHPSVFGAGELPAISDIREKLSFLTGARAAYPQCLDGSSSTLMNTAANGYLTGLKTVSGGEYPIVTDKMPENFWDLGLISRMFPVARIIHCIRDPLDTCISCYFTNFRDGHEYTCDLASLGTYYRQYLRIMQHWKQTIKIPMLELNYEDLVSRPEEMSRQLVAYCGLDWNEKCLSPHKTRRAVRTASFSQVRHKVYTSSVERWRNYGAHIEVLRHALGIQAADT